MAQNTKIEELITPILQAHNAFLVDFQIRGDHRMKIVEIFVDTEAGVNADVCAAISRDVAPILESSDQLPGRFNIVVSSPGLDRPLKFIQQYRRNIGRRLAITFRSPEGQRRIEGELTDVQPNVISIRRDNDQLAELPFDGIVQALVVPRW